MSLAHIDLHHLASSITIVNNNKPFYLLGLLDGYSRIAWVEVLESKKALEVMFACLKSFNILNLRHRIEIGAVLIYYNEHRLHTALEKLTPKEFIENKKNVTN